MRARFVQATTLGDLLDRQAAERPDAEALVFPGERVTFAQLADRAQVCARGLLALGVRRGDRVGVLLPASVDLLAVLFGAAKIGAIAVPVNARFKSVELRQIVLHSGMAVLVTEPASVAELPGDAPELRHVVTGALDAAGVTDEQVWSEQESVRVRDTAVIVYTSGTTAAPKGAMLSHEALGRLSTGIGDRMEITPDDRVWTAIPLFHGGGITFALSCLAAGAAFVHPGFFDPSTTLEYLRDERVTIALAAFETIWMPVLDRPDFAAFDLSGIRIVMAVGVPERLREMARRLPDAVHVSCVAMTESSAFLTLNRLDDPAEQRATTGGHPMPGMACRVVDPGTGADQPPGTPGELLFRGPNAFDGYFRDPALTATVFDDEGWFHSGDVVVADADGRLTFLSRLKDMLKVGGENVAAAEVEGHLLGHPAVGIVAVVAAPDARYVEVPAAFVQLKAGASATAEDLIAFCLGRIATYRVPRYVRFVDEWPMSGTKIKKFVLRERIADELKQAGITEAPKPRSSAAELP
jgi:fatty-acyl-CoA synthase